MALVLTRKSGDAVTIQVPGGEDIVVSLYVTEDKLIRLNIEAPREYKILRNELLGQTDLEKK